MRIPKLRQGTFFPSLLETHKGSEQALLAVIQQAYVLGVTTRKANDSAQTLGLCGVDKSKVSHICIYTTRRDTTSRERNSSQ